MRRVLVTGATGFVGRHALPELLERRYEVHAVTSGVKPDGPPGVSWHRADLLDLEAEAVVARVAPSHLLHFAWYAVPGLFWVARENVAWLEASLRLLRAFEEAGGRRAVLAGTCAEYDWSDGVCVEGETPLEPATLYGACKHALQTAASAFGAEVGMSLAWGRIFFLYGPGEHPERLVASVIRALLAGSPAACTSGAQRRDLLHSQDVASAFVQLLDGDVRGPVNIGSGVPVPIKDVVTAIGNVVGRPDLVRLGELRDRPGEPPLLVADVRRLQDEVGWTPRIPLEEGLRQTIASWRGAAATVRGGD